MILATHALTGAAIGKNVHNPWLVIILSLAVHFIMDAFRHGEYFDSRSAKVKDTAWKVILDILSAGVLIIGYMVFDRPELFVSKNIILGAFFSMFPDLLTVLYWKYEWKFLRPIRKLHEFSHYYKRYPKFSPERQWTLRNSLNDILISLAAIIVLFI